MEYLMGIDLGTSGIRVVLFDSACRQICEATREYPLYQPQNGWAEQDADDWYRAAVAAIGEVLNTSGVAAEKIVGLGLSGQMHGLVMLDAEGIPLRRAILWCDQRTAGQCRTITERVGAQKLLEITCNPALTGFTAGKILWVREHEPEVYAACRHILLPKDYLRYKFTGVFACDVSDASGMQLLDVPHRRWSQEVLQALEISPSLLADVYESPQITGNISPEAAALTGLSEGTAVVGGAGDNAAAAVGMGVVRDGRAFTSIGTSGVVYAHTDQLRTDPLGRVHTFCCAVPGAWHVMGVMQAAGLSMQWLRNNFYPGDSEYAQINSDAAQTPIGANRLLYLPYLMGERTPHLDADCRGAFVGLSAMHTRKDMARAVMEGVTYGLCDSLAILEEMGVKPAQMLACGGGAKSPLWRQMLADAFACPVRTSQQPNSAALGAAILAGVGVGLYPSVPQACDAILRYGATAEPDAGRSRAYRDVYAVYTSLYPALKAPFAALKKLP
ncbi:MAG TPA: xylulokinase [Candidatus Aphodomonas merdavium]|nr:xylulokinase [Candidatus Aphodomonas merdavium]